MTRRSASVRVASFLVSAEDVRPRVVIGSSEVPVRREDPPSLGNGAATQVRLDEDFSGDVGVELEDREATAPLIQLAYARSGDKGNHFNVGVMARRGHFLPHIRAALTEEVVARFSVEDLGRHRPMSSASIFLPGLHAMNFLCRNALDGGGTPSLRLDVLAKQLLDFEIPVPRRLLAELELRGSEPQNAG